MTNKHKKTDLVSQFFSWLKSVFFHGFFTLLPITATIFIIHFTYSLIARWLSPLRSLEPLWLQCVPGAEIIIVTIVIFLIGLFLKLFIIVPVMHHFEIVIKRIPFVRSIYSSAKTLVDFFNFPASSTVDRKVVLIEFPCKGYYHLAFLLGGSEEDYTPFLNKAHNTQEEYCKIFMPHSPNPTTGYFFLIPKSTVIETNITFEEAIKTIVSCGLITPESIKAYNIDYATNPLRS